MIETVHPAPFMQMVSLLAQGGSRLRRRLAALQSASADTYAFSVRGSDAPLMIAGFWRLGDVPGGWADEMFLYVDPALKNPALARGFGPALCRAVRLTLKERGYAGMKQARVYVRAQAHGVPPPGARMARLAGFAPSRAADTPNGVLRFDYGETDAATDGQADGHRGSAEARHADGRAGPGERQDCPGTGDRGRPPPA